MYADPAHIRTERVNCSFSQTEKRALEAIAELNGCQPSAFMRKLFREYVERTSHELNSGLPASAMPGTR